MDQQDTIAATELHLLAKYWHGFVVRGLVICVMGSFFIWYPASSWVAFSTVYGTFALIDSAICFGKFSVVTCCMPELQESKCRLASAYFMGGFCSAVLGSIAIAQPAATAEAMVFILALWLIFSGASQTSVGFIVGDCCSWVVGFLYLFTGMSFLFNIEDNVGFVILWMGICLVMFGLQVIFFGITLKRTYGGGSRLEDGYQNVDEAIV